jgi:mono/diheme cytochrome c family protein
MAGTRISMIALGTAMLLASCAGLKKHYSEPTGRYMYVTYCARCHGEDGKGSPSEVQKPPDTRRDLTALSRRNGGKFPGDQVRLILGGLVDTPAHHGPDPMPIWGDLFDTRRHEDRDRAEEQFETLAAYLESIQQP